MYMCRGKIKLKDGKQRRVDVRLVIRERGEIQEIEGTTSSENGLGSFRELARVSIFLLTNFGVKMVEY